MIFKVALVVVLILSVTTASSLKLKGRKLNDPLVVETKNGLIRGEQRQTVSLGTTYYAFRAIPYAKPPVGNLRFEPPVPVDNWDGVKNTTHDPPSCVQESNPVVGSEDCLYLSVYTPNITANKPLSVMVWIYGGTFITGSANYSLYAPDFFLEQDVVVVTLNYRLGVFGFLSTGDLVVPGNMGLKDQTLAMTWVKNNIERFGGNSNNITIFGESAGAASVSYHLQSSLSRGLYHGAIMQSGVSLCPWALYRQVKQTLDALAVAFLLDRSNSQSFVDGLRKVSYSKLQDISQGIFYTILLAYTPLNGLVFGPVIEPDHAGAFFSKNSHQLLHSGNFNRVPVIIGFNSLELNLQISVPIRIYALRFNADVSELTPVDMNITDPFKRLSVGSNIRQYYFGITPIAADSKDSQFNRPIRKTVELTSTFAPVYYYKFAYIGKLGGVTNRNYQGVQHAEELNYFWYRQITGSKQDNITRDRVVKLWTNFAKFGNPTPVNDPLLENQIWPQATSQNNLTLFLINNSLAISSSSTRRLDFWEQLYNSFGIPPFDTY